MPCFCERCGILTTCGEKYCAWCYIDIELEDDEERNIYAGGRLYGEKLLKEDFKTQDKADVAK